MNRLKYFITVVACGLLWLSASAQQERALVREGNQRYIEGAQLEADSLEAAIKKWDKAAEKYEAALKIDSTLIQGIFNLGDVAYKKGEYDEALKKFEIVVLNTRDTMIQAKAYHNIGNTHLELFDYEKSIEAYKSALRLNPRDMDTKYNLAYAQNKLSKSKSGGEGNNEQDKQPEASEYAKNLKAQAEALAVQKRYQEALEVMQLGMQKDSSVQVFAEFIKRIEDVVKSAPPDTAGVKK